MKCETIGGDNQLAAREALGPWLVNAGAGFGFCHRR